jgi:hypothetical protein
MWQIDRLVIGRGRRGWHALRFAQGGRPAGRGAMTIGASAARPANNEKLLSKPYSSQVCLVSAEEEPQLSDFRKKTVHD